MKKAVYCRHDWKKKTEWFKDDEHVLVPWPHFGLKCSNCGVFIDRGESMDLKVVVGWIE
jgi:hypothetical protein